MKKYKFAICDRINVCKADICPLGRQSCLEYVVCSDGHNKTQSKRHTINYCAWIPRESQQENMVSSTLLSPALQTRVNSLAKKECCNYDRGDCSIMGKKCLQVGSKTVICGWFKKAVLPLDKTLEAEALIDNTNSTSIESSEILNYAQRVRQKQCDICGKTFNSIARNTRHCQKCAEKVHNMQKAESKRKRRSMATK